MGGKKRWWRRRLTPFEIRVVSWLGWLILTLLFRTLRFRTYGEENLPKDRGAILMSWHGQQLFGFYCFRHRGYVILSSLSRDGDISSSIMRRFGWKIVRGSSNRRSAASLIELIRCLRRGDTVGITPEGSSGRLYQIEPGVVFMSQKTGAPMFPIGFVPDRYWEFKTWDRFIIPKPFARCVIFFGPPLTAPPEMAKEEFEAWKGKVAEAIHEANNRGREALEQWKKD